MIGRTLSHYRIVSRLGAGGMGEVYLAEDGKLGRKVALKVLPVAVADDPERLKRLEREARALGALDHPNIVTVHSVEESEGVHFLTMAHVSGETLDDSIPAEGLPVGRLVEIAIALADALRSAHANGVVHRDLKPGNVMIDDEGRVRVLDFGLAKLVGDPSMPGTDEQPTMTMTAEGTVVGTIPYMSPEQVEGKVVDARSDLFSLGVMLYEMATGQRPFRGETALAVASAILKDEPSSLAEERPELPARLRGLIERCLRKESRERIQTAVELLDELGEIRRELESMAMAATTVGPVLPVARSRTRRGLIVVAFFAVVVLGALILDLGGIRRRFLGIGEADGTEIAPIVSLAVLPLTNLSGDPAQEYFVDGMTEALIADLSKIGALKVISRTSVMRFKNTDRPLPEIARELGVDAVVEGSIVREANRVRVTTQLIHADSDRNLWAESYERELRSVLSLQSEIARTIAAAIRVQVTPREATRLAARREIDPEAYDAYLVGRFSARRLTPASLDTALGYFEKALEIDPDFALAHAGIAVVWGGRRQMGFASQSEARARGQAALTRALQLDDSVAEIWDTQASFRTWADWDWARGEAAFRRAIELDPNLASVRRHYSHFLQIMERPEEAMAQIERAIELDPLSASSRAFYGVNLVFARRYDEAIEQFRRALATAPDLPFALHSLSATHWLAGDLDQSVEIQRRARLAFGEPEVERAIANSFREGGFRLAMKRGAEAQIEHSARAQLHPLSVVSLYLMAGENELALDWLEKGFEAHDSGMPYLGLPMYDAVRDHPRFQRLLELLDLPRRSDPANAATTVVGATDSG